MDKPHFHSLPEGLRVFKKNPLQIKEDETKIRKLVLAKTGFIFSDGICPWVNDIRCLKKIRPGFKREADCLIISLSKIDLFDTFIALLEFIFGDRGLLIVDIVLKTSYNCETCLKRCDIGHEDFCRYSIDLSVLLSVLYDYEELLVEDGATGIVVTHTKSERELKFDEHKLLIFYTSHLEEIEKVARYLKARGRSEFTEKEIKTVTDMPHFHSSSERFFQRFEELKTALSVE